MGTYRRDSVEQNLKLRKCGVVPEPEGGATSAVWRGCYPSIVDFLIERDRCLGRYVFSARDGSVNRMEFPYSAGPLGYRCAVVFEERLVNFLAPNRKLYIRSLKAS